MFSTSRQLHIAKIYSISKIAELCGFENVYCFSNVFEKHTGISPKNYKPL